MRFRLDQEVVQRLGVHDEHGRSVVGVHGVVGEVGLGFEEELRELGRVSQGSCLAFSCKGASRDSRELEGAPVQDVVVAFEALLNHQAEVAELAEGPVD